MIFAVRIYFVMKSFGAGRHYLASKAPSVPLYALRPLGSGSSSMLFGTRILLVYVRQCKLSQLASINERATVDGNRSIVFSYRTVFVALRVY